MRDLLEDALKRQNDPVRQAQQAMRAPLPKRFYKAADTARVEGSYAVRLDGKPVRTPARNDLLLPTEAAARLVAAEFEAQEKEIDPARMPATRLTNTAIDGVAAEPQAVFEDILKFASSDLLCYRADAPAELVERQASLWDPVIDWLRDDVGANFILSEGIMHVTQPKEAIASFAARLRIHEGPFALTCLHTMTSLTGSAMLALSVAEGVLSPDEAWLAAHVDEDWNIEQWGEDAEAAARRAFRQVEMSAAATLLAACRNIAPV